MDLVVDGLRGLGAHRSLTAVRKLTTTSAVASLPGVVAAALTVGRANSLKTVAETSDLPLTVDALQYAHGGPCVDAAVTPEAVVHAEDLRTDTRWPAFARATLAETPVLGVLSYHLSPGQHDEDHVGSLNLYATKPHVFDADTITAGRRLAAYTAMLLAYTAGEEKVRNLERALHSNRQIGAAIGILMTRHLVAYEQAFTLISDASQRRNLKLRAIADEVIERGELTPATPSYRANKVTVRG